MSDRTEFDEKIIKKYPGLFPINEETASRWPVIMWGAECYSGWYNLIEECLEGLSKFPINIIQIKQKFGGLRIYYESKNLTNEQKEEIYQILTKAEVKADSTCELCGKPGKLGGTGWISVMCDSCREKSLAKKDQT